MYLHWVKSSQVFHAFEIKWWNATYVLFPIEIHCQCLTTGQPSLPLTYPSPPKKYGLSKGSLTFGHTALLNPCFWSGVSYGASNGWPVSIMPSNRRIEQGLLGNGCGQQLSHCTCWWCHQTLGTECMRKPQRESRKMCSKCKMRHRCDVSLNEFLPKWPSSKSLYLP